MSGRKAKEIRNYVYGDMSLKEERKYFWGSNGGIQASGLRGIYQKMKKRMG